jgi:hypothetical protein
MTAPPRDPYVLQSVEELLAADDLYRSVGKAAVTGQTFTTDDPKWAGLVERRFVGREGVTLVSVGLGYTSAPSIYAPSRRQRVLDEAVRNVQARKGIGWWHVPTCISDSLAAAYRAEFARLWSQNPPAAYHESVPAPYGREPGR